ncbi:alpha/beta hydrolase [candidate division WWE3 bacterium]|uniref:Alpha/beta hydrolase n=1 Tax=candidate division WWE3 bacterium TaxID=2053526 RepID=A0A955LVW2_UNCKA|nr:alpha/beta hydrolase [candidate division WWE3 bacterium]
MLIKDIPTQTPEMPNAYDSAFTYEEWTDEFECFDISPETILVGHSTGGGFLVRWLSETQQAISQLVLVAPYLDPDNKKTNSFYLFDFDRSVPERVGRIDMFVSTDDSVRGVLESRDIIISNWPNISVHMFNDKGHFTEDDMETIAFPELLEVIVVA